MADNRKYYYLKLKENFFDSDSIVLLEDMKDGILYSNILLKLYRPWLALQNRPKKISVSMMTLRYHCQARTWISVHS